VTDDRVYYFRKLMSDLSDALAAIADENWDLARRVLENRAAPAAHELHVRSASSGVGTSPAPSLTCSCPGEVWE
jgi:hypothetical protein